MKESVMTTAHIIDQHREIAKDIDDLEKSIVMLRGKEGLQGMDNDPRLPVKLLVNMLAGKYAMAAEFNARRWVQHLGFSK